MKKAKHLGIASFWNALGLSAYIALVSLFMNNANQIFGKTNGILSFLTFLLLFVLSVSVSGYLIFGKPILMYLDGAKKEAFILFTYNLLWITIFFLLSALIVIAINIF